MKQCPFCAEAIRDEATVCKHCTRAQPVQNALHQAVPTAYFLPIGVMLVGFFMVLISAQPGAPRLLALPGWLILWVSVALGLKGHSPVVRIGGGFILSLLMMGLAISCG